MNQGKQKGITLIALIITIIVMLTLVVVVIRTTINSGLFGHAKDATERWADAQKQEELIGNDLDNTINYYTQGGDYTEPTNTDYFTYEYDEETGTAIITGVKEEYSVSGYYNGKSYPLYIIDKGKKITRIELPERVEYNGKEYVVTEIADAAFGSGADANYVSYVSGPSTEWEEIIIPATVKKIGDYAFGYSTNLTSINIPNTVTSIGNGAFSNCTNLTSINIPNNVTSIGYYAFYDCSSLTSINIPNTVTSIGYEAFRNCTNLTSINIPNTVTSIGSGAFSNCTNLTSINIPNSVTSIGNWAFEYCYSLTSINIPSSVTSMGYGVFYGWTSSQTINCQVEKEPSGWSSSWGSNNRAQIIWGVSM